MAIEEFAEKIADLLKSRLDHATVHVQNVAKNNGIHFMGLVIQEEGSCVSPCIYLEGFHSEYENGDKSMEGISEEIIRLHRKNRTNHNFDVSMFADYSRVCPMLRGRLIHTERNAELLKGLPHREFLDLSLVYYVEIPLSGSQEEGSALIRDGHTRMWKVTEQELYDRAMENMEKTDKARILNMADIFENMRGFLTEDLPEENFQMYILTNRKKWNGAVQMLNRKALEDAAALFGSDFYILPSSVHETILVPAEGRAGTAWVLARTVQEVNRTAVLPEEFLSSHVYRYYAGSGRVDIAA